MGFAKIYDSILRSSIWLEAPSTKLVWITMLVLADKDGFVRASVGGLAHQAGVSKDDCREALKVLASPDEDSQTQEAEGRRILEADGGGWLIVNHSKYREFRTDKQVRDAERARRYRENQKNQYDSEQRDESRSSHSVTGNHAASASASASEIQKENEEPCDASDLAIDCPSKPLSDEGVAYVARKLGFSEAAIHAGIAEFVEYWTVGEGMGRRHSRAKWAAKAREDLRRKKNQNKLTEPDRGKDPDAQARVAARQAADEAADEAHRQALRERAAAAGSGPVNVKYLVRGIG